MTQQKVSKKKDCEVMHPNTFNIVAMGIYIVFIVLMMILFGYTLYLLTARDTFVQAPLKIPTPIFVLIIAFVGTGPFGFAIGNFLVAVLCVVYLYFYGFKGKTQTAQLSET